MKAAYTHPGLCLSDLTSHTNEEKVQAADAWAQNKCSVFFNSHRSVWQREQIAGISKCTIFPCPHTFSCLPLLSFPVFSPLPPPSSPLGCRWRMPHQLFSFLHIKPEVTAAALPKTSRRCAGAVTWQPVQMERSPKNKRCLAWNYSGSPESAAVIREEEEEERHVFVNFSAESSATSSSWSADRTVITAYEISRMCCAKTDNINALNDRTNLASRDPQKEKVLSASCLLCQVDTHVEICTY